MAEHLRYQAPVYFHAAQVLSLFEGKRTFDNPKFWEASQKPADAEAVAGQGRPEKPRRTKTKRAAPGADAHGQESSLVLAVRGGAKTVDEIAEAAELPTDEVQYEILRALLRGDVIQDEQGLLRYQPSVSGPA